VNRKSWLQQTVFCEKVLKRFEIDACDKNETPISTIFKTDLNDEKFHVKKYQEAV
jgi:hypothetical protein